MPTIKGDKTYTLIYKSESHKLHEEFTVKTGQAVKISQPVVLNTDGTVQAAGAASKAKDILGIALQDASADELVTVACKGYAQTYGTASGAAILAGPVKVQAGADANGYIGYENVAGGDTEDALIVGWALDAGSQDDVVRIMLNA